MVDNFVKWKDKRPLGQKKIVKSDVWQDHGQQIKTKDKHKTMKTKARVTPALQNPTWVQVIGRVSKSAPIVAPVVFLSRQSRWRVRNDVSQIRYRNGFYSLQMEDIYFLVWIRRFCFCSIFDLMFSERTPFI